MKVMDAYILAGGRSSRMGTDKGLVMFNNRPLITCIIDTLKPYLKINIVSGNDEYLQFGYPVIADEHPFKGPMAGLHSALGHSRFSYVLLLSCDMPFLTFEAINFLIMNSGEHDAVVPLVGDKPEPLCAVYSKNLLPEINSRLASGNLSMQNLIYSVNYKFVAFDEMVNLFPDLFFNVNNSEDLKKLIIK